MKPLKTSLYYILGIVLLSTLGCVTPSDIDAEKPHYSQGKFTIPFDVKEKEQQATQPAP